MPKETGSTGADLETYVAKLMSNGAAEGTVTEDDIQIALRDIEVTDEQLNNV